jgi:copper homeostasis protein (lipoprotein)
MKYSFVLICLILFACHNKNNSNNTINKTANQPRGFDVKNIQGVFYNTLPCADCPGIATKLYLKPDDSFIMEQKYLNRNIVYDLGRWSVTDSILKLTGTEGISQFKILNQATIKLLDNEGRMIYDTTSAHLVLLRDNTPFKPLKLIPVEGTFYANRDTMNIHICAMDNNYPVALAPKAMGMKAAYNKAAHQKNEPLYAKLEGHFELRPVMGDTITKDFFVVEHFINFVAGQQCK